jgi:hypothetical protein
LVFAFDVGFGFFPTCCRDSTYSTLLSCNRGNSCLSQPCLCDVAVHSPSPAILKINV